MAYLFPGTVGALGIYLLLLLTPLADTLIAIPKDLAAGVVFLGLSYIIGVILSGFSEIGLIIGSVILALINLGTIFNRMMSNDRREVRETLAAFVAGYKAGAFDQAKERTPPTSRSQAQPKQQRG
jgi:hypothetical protein